MHASLPHHFTIFLPVTLISTNISLLRHINLIIISIISYCDHKFQFSRFALGQLKFAATHFHLCFSSSFNPKLWQGIEHMKYHIDHILRNYEKYEIKTRQIKIGTGKWRAKQATATATTTKYSAQFYLQRK